MRYSLYFFAILSLICTLSAQAQTWEALSSGISTNMIWFDIDFPDGQSNVGYFGGSSATYMGKGKILKTTDNGNTLSIVYDNSANGSGISALFFLSPNEGFAGRQDGQLMKTTDGGNTWNSADIDPTADQGDINCIRFYDSNNGLLTTSYEGIYRTTDGGASWTHISGISYLPSKIDYADALNVFGVASGQRILKSSNGGATWSQVFQGPSPGYILLGIDFGDSQNGLAVGESDMAFVTHDAGVTWTQVSMGNSITIARGTHVIDANTMYASANPGQVYKSTDGGSTWTEDDIMQPNPSYTEVIFTANGTGYVGGSGATGGTIRRKLAEAAALTATYSVTDAGCYGASNGLIIATPSGGTEPYTFAWSNGTNNSIAGGLAAGDYTCTVSDATGTSLTLGPITVSQFDEIIITATSNAESLAGANDGTANLTSVGTATNPSILWSNGSTETFISGLSPDEYCVTVTDGSTGCSATTCTTVAEGPSATDLPGLLSMTCYPNPVSNELTFQANFATTRQLMFEVRNAQGVLVSNRKPAQSTQFDLRFDMSTLPSGAYTLRILSDEGKPLHTLKVLKQ